MAVTVEDVSPRSGSSDWARRYPPLLSVAIAVLIALAVLPSALNIPQTNPTQTVEIAPVPPTDEDVPPPPSGNFSQLGLGGTSTLSEGPGDTGAAQLPPPGDLPVVGKNPSTKRCVGNPPRQTADPMSPPCVAHFSGDNFGATYQGVTKDEVRIVSYQEGGWIFLGSSGGSEGTPDNRCFDLAKPPEEDEHVIVRSHRVWQQYFNERYQTYNRFVHFFVCFSPGGNNGPEARRADAAEHYAKFKPFAALNFAHENSEEYLESMARRGVLNFGSWVGRDAAFFQKYPKMIWGYYPSIEQQANMFSNALCTQVARYESSFAGDAALNAKPRKYGYWRTRDEGRQGLIRYAELVKSNLADCGIEFAAEHTFPVVGFTHNSQNVPTYATRAVADFQTKNVTTIIWPGGLETNFTKAADSQNYLPEIIVSGDQQIENNGFQDDQAQRVWENASILSNVTAVPPVEEQECYQAYRETDPSAPRVDITFVACRYYIDIRQLFIGIQVAGPRLGPTSVDKGQRAIPEVRSTDPMVPACFYNPGDYTCVKDMQLMHYDATEGPDGEGPCLRMAEGGLRYIPGSWPDRNLSAIWKPDDPCNNYSTGSGSTINPGAPDPENPEG